MELVVFGLNHKTAPLHIRERLALREEEQATLALQANELCCEEAFLLSTCNRVELYGALKEGATGEPAEQALSGLFAAHASLELSELTPHLYHYQGDEALLHLLRVASSLDSMVVGEPQILGQLKGAYERCRDEGATARLLSALMDQALSVAKRVRTHTEIGRSVVSISSVAVNLAEQIFEQLTESSVLLVGAGEMGELAAQHLLQAGVGRLFVANRSLERASSLAERLGGHPRDLTELPELLTSADIVITSTGAHGYLITKDLIAKRLKARKYRPLFLIDISVPRNIEPSVNELENVYVYDVDDLNEIASQNKASRAREANAAEEMVLEELKRLKGLQAKRELGPTLKAIREQVHELKRAELEWAAPRLAELTPEQQKLVEQLAERLSNKLLHGVMTGLKGYAERPERALAIEVAEQLFGLTPSSPSQQTPRGPRT